MKIEIKKKYLNVYNNYVWDKNQTSEPEIEISKRYSRLNWAFTVCYSAAETVSIHSSTPIFPTFIFGWVWTKRTSTLSFLRYEHYIQTWVKKIY